MYSIVVIGNCRNGVLGRTVQFGLCCALVVFCCLNAVML